MPVDWPEPEPSAYSPEEARRLADHLVEQWTNEAAEYGRDVREDVLPGLRRRIGSLLIDESRGWVRRDERPTTRMVLRVAPGVSGDQVLEFLRLLSVEVRKVGGTMTLDEFGPVETAETER